MVWPISIKNERNFQNLVNIFHPRQKINEKNYLGHFNDDNIKGGFTVLEGTKYTKETDWGIIEPSWVPFIAHYDIAEYNSRCQDLLNLPLTKDMFKEHSLFLLKESLKTFSPYSDKAKELLKKLESLE